MSKTVVKFYPNNAADNPDNVLEQAMGEYEDIFIVGYSKDGDFDCRASTNVTRKDILWMLEHAKMRVLDLIEDE